MISVIFVTTFTAAVKRQRIKAFVSPSLADQFLHSGVWRLFSDAIHCTRENLPILANHTIFALFILYFQKVYFSLHTRESSHWANQTIFTLFQRNQRNQRVMRNASDRLTPRDSNRFNRTGNLPFGFMVLCFTIVLIGNKISPRTGTDPRFVAFNFLSAALFPGKDL